MSNRDSRVARHIVVVLHDFYAGGAERVAITLANAWRGAGRKVTLLCGCEEGPFRDRVEPGVRVETVQPLIPQGRLSRIRLGCACAHALRGRDVDVVFAPGNFHLPVVGIAARAHYARRPVFTCKLSNKLDRASRSRLRQAVFNATTRMWTARLDGIVAMSQNLQDEARVLLHRRAIDFIWEPCVIDSPPPAAERPASGTEAPRILVAARLVAEKNVSLALRTLAILARRTTATLQIVGDGPLRACLERESRALGIADRVRWAGHVPDIRPYLANARVLLSTSDYEGYPAVLIEALAAGVPVVATDSSPALSEILFDRTFGTITARIPEALASAVEQVLDLRPAAAPLAQLVARHRADMSAQAYLDWFDALRARRALS